MKLNTETRTVVLEATNCRSCKWRITPGTQAVRVSCPTCGGSGKGPRGGQGGCKKCHGNGSIYDQDLSEPCAQCKGNYVNFDTETWTDNVPAEFFRGMPIEVVEQDRNATWNEQHLGSGMLWSCIDYGRHKRIEGSPNADITWQEKLADDIMTQLLNDARVQLSGIVLGKTDLKLCDKLVIVCTRDGYGINAVWED